MRVAILLFIITVIGYVLYQNANAILSASLSDRVMQLRMAEIQRDTIVASAKKGNVIISGDATPLVQVN